MARRRYFCGTPREECRTATYITNAMMTRDQTAKLHASSEEAFRCYSRYLQGQGWKRVGGREFAKETGPILVLTRKTKFGTELRLGKNQDGKGSRFEPMVHRGFIHVI